MSFNVIILLVAVELSAIQSQGHRQVYNGRVGWKGWKGCARSAREIFGVSFARANFVSR